LVRQRLMGSIRKAAHSMLHTALRLLCLGRHTCCCLALVLLHLVSSLTPVSNGETRDIPHWRASSMSSPSVAPRDALADLPTLAAQFEQDVQRVETWVNADKNTDYTTETGVSVPSVQKVIANVNAMIAPDLAAINKAVTDSQSAASAASNSATSASTDATTASNAADLAESYSTTASSDATTATDAATRADASAQSAATARDNAAASMTSAQQASSAAASSQTAAASSATAAASSATASSNSATQSANSATAANTSAGNSASSASAALGSQQTAATSATNAASSATASANSATQSANSATASANSATQSANSAASINPANLVKKAGDTMTGDLSVQAASFNFLTSAGAVQARFRGDPTYGIGFVNIANAAWNFYVTDAGNAAVRGTFTAAGGTLTGTLSINAASLHMRFNQANGTLGPVMQYAGVWGVTDAANANWNLQITDAGNTTIRGGLTVAGIQNNGGLNSTGQIQSSNYYVGYGGTKPRQLAQDPNLARGGGVGFLNNANNAWTFFSSDDGSATFQSNVYVGSAVYQTDGNITNMGWASGQALSTIFSQKAASGGNCRLASGQNFGVVSNQGGALPLPYVVYGLTGPANGTANAISIYGAIVQAV
jgi:hypothetical protein